jgi:hypothetical protein
VAERATPRRVIELDGSTNQVATINPAGPAVHAGPREHSLRAGDFAGAAMGLIARGVVTDRLTVRLTPVEIALFRTPSE